jgi:hypothetical protein
MNPIRLAKKIDGKFKTVVELKKNQWGNWEVSFSPEFKKQIDSGEWVNLSLFEGDNKTPKTKPPEQSVIDDVIPF